MSWTALLSVSGTVIAVTTLMLVMLQFSLARREVRRREDMARLGSEQRVLLEDLRANYEREIYRLQDRLASSPDRFDDVNHLVLDGTRMPSRQASTSGPADPLRSFGLDPREVRVDPRQVMVLMPFHSQYDAVLDSVLEAGRELGLKVVRGDESLPSGPILQHVVATIASSRLVVALLDGRNPNVFYELGVAHALGKSTVLLASTIDEVPFDLRGSRLITFEKPSDLRQSLVKALASALV